MRINLPPLTPEERAEQQKMIDEAGGTQGLLDSLRDMGLNVQVIDAKDAPRPPARGCISS